MRSRCTSRGRGRRLGLVVALLLGAALSGEAAAAPPGRWTEVRVRAPARAGAPARGAATGRVLVYVPAGLGPRPAPLLVALHGWGGRADEWRRHPELVALADRHGVIVACPDVGKTVYESRYYPESRGRWGPVPGAVWLGEVVLPHLRATLPVRRDRAGTAILGYSTGGRGAIVVAQRYPEFGFAASLSGTYDLGALEPAEGEYTIHAVVFGPRARHRARWRDEDCVVDERVAPLRATALYLAHGGADRVVGVSQLRSMARFLARHGVKATVVIDDGAGHDWKLWGAQLAPAFAALARVASAPPAAP